MNIRKDDKVVLANQFGKPINHGNGTHWIVVSIDSNKLTVHPENNTKEKQVFHKSRVIECNNNQIDAVNIADKQSSITDKFKPTKETTKMAKHLKQKPAKTEKTELVSLNLKELVNDNSELYYRPIGGFDHKDIKVIGYCLIAPDKKSYKCFNTYNGSLGKKSGKSIPKKRYDIKERDGGYTKFVNELLKKGYSKF